MTYASFLESSADEDEPHLLAIMSFGLSRTSDIGVGPSNFSGIAIDSSTPWTAIAEGNLPLLQESLRQLQYSASVADEIQGYTLLQAAASYNQFHILQWLWAQLHELNQIADDGSTARPLGGWQNAVDFDGDTALHYAGSVESMKFLLDVTNIDVHVQNSAGMTALDAKRSEMNEMEQDEDEFDEDDREYKQLKAMVQYLESTIMNPQQD
jgi:Ankyrin repeats (3 copies)